MSGHSWRFMRVAGIDVRIDSSWLIIAALVSYSLFFGLTAVYPAVGTVAAAVISILGAALFFGSVLCHELMHAVVAKRRGFRVKDITLYLFGGATQTNIESKGPFDEFIVSVVGPLCSFGLAILFGVARALVLSVEDGALAGILGYLAWANVLLGFFNLLPGLPLDGGRVLRSALWKSTGNLDRSTKVASVAGEVLGYSLIAVGALVFFAGGSFRAFGLPRSGGSCPARHALPTQRCGSETSSSTWRRQMSWRQTPCGSPPARRLPTPSRTTSYATITMRLGLRMPGAS